MTCLHSHLDSGNLLPLLNKTFGEPWRHLPQLDRNRTAGGVDNDFAPFEIRNMRAWREVGRQHEIKCVLQASQTRCLF